LVGAPNCAPSLRSVAGLLLALALESRYEDTAPLLGEIVTARAPTRDARLTGRTDLDAYGAVIVRTIGSTLAPAEATSRK